VNPARADFSPGHFFVQARLARAFYRRPSGCGNASQQDYPAWFGRGTKVQLLVRPEFISATILAIDNSFFIGCTRAAAARGLTDMSSLKHKLRIAGAFGALAALALAISCRGFFVKPTLTSIAVSPTAPEVEQGKTLQLQLFGTYDDGSRSQVKSGVSWSSSAPTIASVDPNSGILTGLQTGSTTITADAQGLSSTASATVFIVIAAISIAPQNPSLSGGTGSGSQNFTISGSVNGQQVNISSGASVVANLNGAQASTISCAFDSTQNVQVCTATNASLGVYNIVATYTGSTLQATTTWTIQ
jgi:hypothetical protein